MAEIRGEDYAAAGVTDSTTALGMRFALFEAVNQFNARPESERTAENAIIDIGTASRNNDLLQAAGTQEVIARFYEERARKGDVVSFLNAIPPTDLQTIQDAIDAQKGNFDVVQFLNPFGDKSLLDPSQRLSDASKQYLHMGTLTETLLGDLKNNPALTDGVTITPGTLTQEQAETVASFDGFFRGFDNFTPPTVQHLVVPPAPEVFTNFGINNNSKGFSTPVPDAIKQIMDTNFGSIIGSVEPAAYQGQDFSDLIQNADLGALNDVDVCAMDIDPKTGNLTPSAACGVDESPIRQPRL